MKEILESLEIMFPDAHCELNYHNSFELVVAVALSAQATDVSVNACTIALFDAYPDCYSLAEAHIEDVIELIKTIGLYQNKAKNIINLAKMLVNDFNGVVPNSMEDLIKLPGVGRKTANVCLAELYSIPTIPVDTHVYRVSKRLGLVDEKASVLETEKTLMRLIPKEKWIDAHHQLVFFGRYMCHAFRPQCNKCLLKEKCKGQ